jgi:hypothetical protein
MKNLIVPYVEALPTFKVSYNCLNSYGILVTRKGQCNKDDYNKGNHYYAFW